MAWHIAVPAAVLYMIFMKYEKHILRRIQGLLSEDAILSLLDNNCVNFNKKPYRISSLKVLASSSVLKQADGSDEENDDGDIAFDQILSVKCLFCNPNDEFDKMNKRVEIILSGLLASDLSCIKLLSLRGEYMKRIKWIPCFCIK